MAKVFEPYEQGIQVGTGLGLPLSKSLVALMGSKTGLTLSRASSGGSIFCFEITCKAASYEPPGVLPQLPADRIGVASAYGSPTATLAGECPTAMADLRVLIADDLKMNRLLLKRRLRHALPSGRFASFYEAETGERALQMLMEGTAGGSAARFDIAILDENYRSAYLAQSECRLSRHRWTLLDLSPVDQRTLHPTQLRESRCALRTRCHAYLAIEGDGDGLGCADADHWVHGQLCRP